MTNVKRTQQILLCSSLVAVLLFVVGGCHRNAGLTIVSFGGAYQDAQHKAYMAPFSEQLHTPIREGQYNGEYGLIRERALDQSGPWDVVSVESGPAMRGGNEGLFAPIPDRVFAGKSMTAGSRRQFSAGHLVFSTVLAYRTDAISGSRVPATWADFWDLNTFPGKRALRRNPRGTLEIALLADGVDPKHLYPLDVERALRKLDQIRTSLVFWDAGAQPVSLLANRTVIMSSAYSGRIWDAETREHLPFAIQFNQGLSEIEFWAVPKSSHNKDTAFDFIAFSLGAERQAAFANTIAYGPTNTAAIPLLTLETKKGIPTTSSEIGSQIPVNADWWAANEGSVNARWNQWIQGH